MSGRASSHSNAMRSASLHVGRLSGTAKMAEKENDGYGQVAMQWRHARLGAGLSHRAGDGWVGPGIAHLISKRWRRPWQWRPSSRLLAAAASIETSDPGSGDGHPQRDLALHSRQRDMALGAPAAGSRRGGELAPSSVGARPAAAISPTASEARR